MEKVNIASEFVAGGMYYHRRRAEQPVTANRKPNTCERFLIICARE
jgi:hypothetical protein